MVDFKCSFFVQSTFQCTPICSLYTIVTAQKIILKDVDTFLWLNISGDILTHSLP